jgi:hypothetical protein
MPLYGILKSSTNTGLDSELACVFAAPITIDSNQPAFTSDTMTLRRISASQNVQRWELDATIKLSDDPTDLFINNLNSGKAKVFPVRMPQLYRAGREMPKGLTFTTAETHSVGTEYINLSGAFRTFMLAEFIRFKNHNKIYAVTEVTATGIKIFPQLTEYTDAGTVLEYGGNVTMTAKYDNNVVLGIKYEDGILASPGTYRIIEAF